jgi:arylsulfatase A-like enzyme
MTAPGDRGSWNSLPGTARLLLAIAASLLLAGCGRALPEIEHVVIVCIDTLRADHVGAYGYDRETTPFLDELARQGVRFRHAWAPSSWTVPSVASLMTSLLPEEHGAFVPGEPRHLSDARPPQQIAPGVPTLPELLAAAGFATGLFSANPFLYGRFQDGFEAVTVDRVDASTLTDAALSWLRRSEGHRRFLYVQYMDVHHPNHPPEPYFSMFEGPPDGERLAEHGEWRYSAQRDLEDADFTAFRAHRIAAYDGAIRYVDRQLERLVAGLEELGLLESSLLIVTSDHGEEFWDHARAQQEWSDDPRRIWGVGHGHTLFDELLRIPLIVRGRGFTPGEVSDCDVSLLDIVPTVAAAVGLEPPPGARGSALINSTRAPRPACRRPMLASELAYGPKSHSLRIGELKLSVRGDRRAQLFDTLADPGEHHDVSGLRPEVVERMQTHLDRVLRRLEPAEGAVSSPFDPELREQLEALGYL